MNNLCWNDELQCHWSAWRVISERHLALDLPPHNSCDMSGAIRIAQFLCPDVDKIDTYHAGLPDTRYRFNHDDDKWEAFVPARNSTEQ